LGENVIQLPGVKSSIKLFCNAGKKMIQQSQEKQKRTPVGKSQDKAYLYA